MVAGIVQLGDEFLFGGYGAEVRNFTIDLLDFLI